MKTKRAILVILGIIAVCCVFLAGIVSAAKAGYSFAMDTGTDATTDGKISPTTEWDDSYKDFLYNGWTMTTSLFRCKWGSSPAINEHWLMEILTDTTANAGDWWEICCDTTQAGGSAPQTADWKINWSAAQGIKAWKGTGSGWTAFTAAVVGTSSDSPGDVFAATTISASPASSTPHRIIEIYLDKGAFNGGALAMGLSNCERLGAYDANTGTTYMWPPYSSADVPDTYGTEVTDISGGTMPEGLTVGVMMALSSIAVIVSIRYFRKQPKI
jgi:hypothetical protein